VRPESASQSGRDRAVEEDPDVSTASGARPLERSGHAQAATGLEERLGIFPPAGLVEVDVQKVASLVREEGVDPGDEGLTVDIGWLGTGASLA